MSQTLEQMPSRIPWPPILYLCAIAASVLLNHFWPLPWLRPPLSDLLFAIGWFLVAGSLFMDVAAIRTLRKANTTIMPTKGAEHLVTSGPFSFTRNPIYLGNTVLMLAIGLITGIVWFLPLAFVAALATRKLAIEPEERYLFQRFGKRYRDYQKKVRRWI